jgi:tol-pal system protein YbgF
MRKRFPIIVIWAVALALQLAPQGPAGPLSQNQLIEALKAGGLSAADLSAIIQRRGLDFEMSMELEKQFRNAGADSEIVRALWEKEHWSPPKGDALTKDLLLALLQSDAPLQRLPKWIVARKVNLNLTPDAATDLRAAGASDQVLALIATNNINSGKGPLLAQSTPLPENLARDLYTTALRNFYRGDYSLASSEFVEMTRIYPDDSLSGNAYYYMGDIEYAGGKFAAAIKDYDHVIEHFADNSKVPASLLKKGMALLALNQNDAGISTMRDLISRFPRTPEAGAAMTKLHTLGVYAVPNPSPGSADQVAASSESGRSEPARPAKPVIVGIHSTIRREPVSVSPAIVSISTNRDGFASDMSVQPPEAFTPTGSEEFLVVEVLFQAHDRLLINPHQFLLIAPNGVTGDPFPFGILGAPTNWKRTTYIRNADGTTTTVPMEPEWMKPQNLQPFEISGARKLSWIFHIARGADLTLYRLNVEGFEFSLTQ